MPSARLDLCLVTVGNLSVDTSDSVGFDISGVTGRAHASLTVGGATGVALLEIYELP